ncbi:hypothetical protein K3712_000543 [Escherichia coli]|nr:hypothetical protein [Escherichia coli]
MGKVVSAITGHSGGGTTKTKENSNQTQNQYSWLQENNVWKGGENQALGEMNNFNMPGYQFAGSNSNLDKASQFFSNGTDNTQYKTAADLMQQQGLTGFNRGTNNLNEAYSKYQNLSNMSQEDMQNMLKSEYNSDLVKSEIAGATQDINQGYADQVQALNQQANAAGGMGNSRAGVAQGIMAGKAQQAIANASVNFRAQEEGAATQRVNNFLGVQQNTAGAMAGIGQNQIGTGLQQYGAGMGYYSQYNQAQTQNAQNQFQIGQYERQQQQAQYDVNRTNQILSQSPALARLAYYGQTFLPMAGLNTSGTGTYTGSGTNVAPGQGGNMLGGFMGMAGAAYGQSKGWSDNSTGLFSMGASMFGNSFGG